jgi:hypothetical protein
MVFLQGVTLNNILNLFGQIGCIFFAKPTLMPIMAIKYNRKNDAQNYIFERIEMKAAGTGE